MNVFIISPGRTGTKSLANAFSVVPGYTSGHETRCRHLGDSRVDYPDNHIEADTKLTWFLPRLYARYGQDSVLVIVNRNREAIARSYNRKWMGVVMMKGYSQGILLRELDQNGLDVCRDYVRTVYEYLDAYKDRWHKTVEIDLACPKKGILEVLEAIGQEDQFYPVWSKFQAEVLNKSPLGNRNVFWRLQRAIKFDLRILWYDIQQVIKTRR